jgi:hypothetical protein
MVPAQSLSENSKGWCFWGKGWRRGETKENTPSGSSIEEQRSQTAFSAKTSGRLAFCLCPALARLLQPAAGMLLPRRLGQSQNPQSQHPFAIFRQALTSIFAMSVERVSQSDPEQERILPDFDHCRVSPSEISGLVYCLVAEPKNCNTSNAVIPKHIVSILYIGNFKQSKVSFDCELSTH